MYLLDLERCVCAILPADAPLGREFSARLRRGGEAGRGSGPRRRRNLCRQHTGRHRRRAGRQPGADPVDRLAAIAARAADRFGAERRWLVLAPSFRRVGNRRRCGLVAAVAVVAGCWRASIDPIPGELIAYGRRMALNAGQSKILYTAEGSNSSVAISQWNDGTIYVNVNGHVEATTELYDMKLQRMVGHLPALLHPNPKSVLGIGFGAGVSAGTFTRYPSIQKITVCEIEPVIPPALDAIFRRQDYHVAHNPRTHIVFDDARHYLLTTTRSSTSSPPIRWTFSSKAPPRSIRRSISKR